MGLIDKMPLKLEQWQDVPQWLEIGYAMWVVRSMLGGYNGYRESADIYRDLEGNAHVIRWTHRQYKSVEEQALANIILEGTSPEPIELQDQRTEEDYDQPRIKQHFLQSVDFVLQHLNNDGTCRVRNKRGEVQWSGSPYKIAAELNVLPSAVRQAQAQLAQKKGA